MKNPHNLSEHEKHVIFFDSLPSEVRYELDKINEHLEKLRTFPGTVLWPGQERNPGEPYSKIHFANLPMRKQDEAINERQRISELANNFLHMRRHGAAPDKTFGRLSQYSYEGAVKEITKNSEYLLRWKMDEYRVEAANQRKTKK